MKASLSLCLLLAGIAVCRGWLNSGAIKLHPVGFRSGLSTIRTTQISSTLTDSQTNPFEYDQPIPKRTPIGSTPEFVLETDSAEVTPTQTALVATHFCLLLANLAIAITHIPSWTITSAIWTTISFILSVFIGDFATGVFHWSVDNYGNIRTPIVGSICAAFQGHHNTPWTITFRPFANNVYKIAKSTIPAYLLCLGAGLGLGMNVYMHVFFTFFINWWLISQELHKYAHMKQPPGWIHQLQSLGVILTRKEHGMHHTDPFHQHYCILTGSCNSFLDSIDFFRVLEKVVFKLTGKKPLTWGNKLVEEKAMAKLTGW